MFVLFFILVFLAVFLPTCSKTFHRLPSDQVHNISLGNSWVAETKLLANLRRFPEHLIVDLLVMVIYLVPSDTFAPVCLLSCLSARMPASMATCLSAALIFRAVVFVLP